MLGAPKKSPAAREGPRGLGALRDQSREGAPKGNDNGVTSAIA